MKSGLYLLMIIGGTDIEMEGPFGDEDARLDRAREWCGDEAETQDGDNVFKLSIDEEGSPSTGVYTESDLDPEDLEDDLDPEDDEGLDS